MLYVHVYIRYTLTSEDIMINNMNYGISSIYSNLTIV